MNHLALRCTDHRLTTAEINYWRPDHPALLQQFIWQELDTAPQFPILTRFLQFWERELDGRLHLVRVANTGLLQPAEFRWVDHALSLH